MRAGPLHCPCVKAFDAGRVSPRPTRSATRSCNRRHRRTHLRQCRMSDNLYNPHGHTVRRPRDKFRAARHHAPWHSSLDTRCSHRRSCQKNRYRLDIDLCLVFSYFCSFHKSRGHHDPGTSSPYLRGTDSNRRIRLMRPATETTRLPRDISDCFLLLIFYCVTLLAYPDYCQRFAIIRMVHLQWATITGATFARTW